MQTRSTDVSVGQNVSAGQTIGRVGATGSANGNHLHLMLRVNGKDIDPLPHITGHSNQGDDELSEQAGKNIEKILSLLLAGKAGESSRGEIRALLEEMPGKTAAATLDAAVPRTGVDVEGKPRTGNTSLKQMIGHHEHQIGLTRRIVESIQSIVKTLLIGDKK